MIFDHKYMRTYFELLECTRGVEQGEDNHPEGDVLNHSLQTFKWGVRESNDTDLLLAALLHDIGKSENTLGHDKIAIEWLDGIVSVKTSWLIEQHMRIWYLILGKMKKQSKIRYLTDHPWLPELIQLARWDKLGRNPNINLNLDRDYIIDILNKKVELHFKEGG